MTKLEYDVEPLWKVFDDWAADRRNRGVMCTLPSLKACHCYAKRLDRRCGQCFERFMEGRSEKQ
ncbi:MAG: hypothetical protein ABIG95_02770 [Candidatus Woesearchaeota archaeon]